jgi:type I restriction enzyme S subunit
MRKGWTETTLGEIASFYNGKTYKQEELLDNGKYRVLRVGNFFSNGNWYWSDLELEENKYCDRGDLLYAWSASFGPRIWGEEKVIYHYHIWKIVEDSSLVNKQFLYYWLDDDVLRMKRDTGNGSIMMHITKGGIEARTIQLPPLAEQKSIVDVMSSVDAYIDALQQQVESARVARNAVLDELLFSDCDDWLQTTIGEIAVVKGGKRLPKGTPWSESPTDHPYIRATDIRDGNVDVNNLVYVPDSVWSTVSRYVVNSGDVLITIAGTIGGIGIVPESHVGANLTENAALIRPNKDLILPKFLQMFLMQTNAQAQIESLTIGTTQKKLGLFRIESIEIQLPALAEQERIVGIVSSMDEVIQSTEQAVVDAKALRSGLLADLLSGNHEIPASYDSLMGAA